MWTNSLRIISGTLKFMAMFHVFHLWVSKPDWSFCSTESTHFLNGIKIIPSWIAYVAFHHGIILMPTTLANCTSGIILMPTRLKLCSTESTQFLNGIKIMPSWIVCVVFHHGIILIPTTTLTMAIWHYSNANFGIKIIPWRNATKFSFGIILIPWCKFRSIQVISIQCGKFMTEITWKVDFRIYLHIKQEVANFWYTTCIW